MHPKCANGTDTSVDTLIHKGLNEDSDVNIVILTEFELDIKAAEFNTMKSTYLT